MYRWFKVSLNGEKTAVRARTAEEAMEREARFSGMLSIRPGTTACEISDEEAENYWYKIR